MGFVVTWLLLAGLWIGLSGFFDPVHLVFGFLSVTLVSAISHRHLTGGGPVGRGSVRMLRLLAYLPWLLWQVLLANVDVLLRIAGLRPIHPRVIRFKPDLDGDFALTTLANSITLTPGTVTVEVSGDEFVVHALNAEAAEAVLQGAMEAKVRWVAVGRRVAGGRR